MQSRPASMSCLLSALALCSLQFVPAAYAGNALLSSPTPATVPELVEIYIADGEKKLVDEDRETLRQIKARLSAARNALDLRKRSNDLVSQLSIALASLRSAKGLTVASAYLLKFDPSNPRAMNLFGEVLHATDRYQDAAIVLEAFLAQAPTDGLAQLNLANVYLDLGRDAEAKKLLDQVLKREPDCREAWKAMAAYWLKKKNLREFQAALLKSASFEGYVAHKAAQADLPVDANLPEPGDSLEQMEPKLAVLDKQVPLTTADLIEGDLPREAKMIRDKYGRLLDAERFKLPLFPQVKTNAARDYHEHFPVIGAWTMSFAEKHKTFLLREQYEGRIDPNASEQQNADEGQAMAQEQLSKVLQDSQEAMKFLQGMPGVDPAMVREALDQIKAAAQQQGVTLTNQPVDLDNPPGWDSGGVFSKANYRNYQIIVRAYENYLRKYFDDYAARVQDNFRVYTQKMTAESNFHDDKDRSNSVNCQKGGADCQVLEKQETLRHKKAVNDIGDSYYRFWVTLYIPQYTRKMKPMLEKYWSVSALYIRNMHDPEVMQREYLRVKGSVMMYALQAGAAAGAGVAFAYMGTTEEEEAELQAAIAAAEEVAPVKLTGFLQEFKTARERDWVDWIGDNLVFEASVEALSLKITATSIEFEAFAPLGVGAAGLVGPAAGFKVDFLDETLETYTAVAAKASFGVTVAKVGVKGEAKIEFAKRTAKWDFLNGKYAETTTLGAKGEAKGQLGPLLSGTSEFELDVQGNAKIGGKLSAGIDTGEIATDRFGKVKLPDLSLSIKGEVSNQK